MCEHSRRRYAARAVLNINGIPEPRMSQLPTNPILAALPTRVGNRRISAGFIVDAASAPRRTTISALRHSLDTSPVISTPQFSGRTLHCPARRRRIMKCRACGTHAMPRHGPLQLLGRRHTLSHALAALGGCYSKAVRISVIVRHKELSLTIVAVSDL
jgi:hypothetical protein